MIKTLAIANYRSLRDVVIPLGRLNLITGPNGSGKTNLYRALKLLADTAGGAAIESIALEGGLHSLLWAGPERFSRDVAAGLHEVEGTSRSAPVQLRLGFQAHDFGYAIDYGLPADSVRTMFVSDAEIKREVMWHGGAPWHHTRMIVERKRALVRTRNELSAWEVAHTAMDKRVSLLSQLTDPFHHPDVYRVAHTIDKWRFYDQFRTDQRSPARHSHVGTHTPIVSHDGHDLPSAWVTIEESGDGELLHAHLDDAFPGAQVNVVDRAGYFDLELKLRGLLRPLRQSELSDGTLRYLYWLVALLSSRPPDLMVLNEPETSLHNDLIPALGRLIVSCADRAQVWVVSHSRDLAECLKQSDLCSQIQLANRLSETVIENQGLLDRPAWRWPPR